MGDFNTPNVVLPLASSYNERDVLGYTATTSGRDQRKVNSFYEVASNAMSGRRTLTLTKRPGVTDGGLTIGANTQTPYLSIYDTANSPGIVYVSTANDIIAATASASTTMLNSAVYKPAFWDRTEISGTAYVVVQLRQSNTTVHRVFFGNPRPDTEIIDADFTGIIHRGKMEFIDGYAFIMAGDGSNKILNSDLNSLANWPSDGFITKGIKLDRAAGLARFKNQLLAFGQESCERFRNEGNPVGSPLSRVDSSEFGLGGVSGSDVVTGKTHYYCSLGERIYFVGREAGGRVSVGVYSYDGARFEKVSSNYIDKLLLESDGDSVYSVNRVGFHGKSAVAIQMTAPGAAQQRWLMFFPSWNEWFEWESDVFGPVNNGEYFLGCKASSSRTEDLFYFNDANKWQDDATAFTQTTQFKLPKNGQALERMPMCGVDADTAGSTSNLGVSFSDDDGATWSTARNIDLSAKLKMLTRCGAYNTRHVRLTHSANLDCRLHSFFARTT